MDSREDAEGARLEASAAARRRRAAVVLCALALASAGGGAGGSVERAQLLEVRLAALDGDAVADEADERRVARARAPVVSSVTTPFSRVSASHSSRAHAAASRAHESRAFAGSTPAARELARECAVRRRGRHGGPSARAHKSRR